MSAFGATQAVNELLDGDNAARSVRPEEDHVACPPGGIGEGRRWMTGRSPDAGAESSNMSVRELVLLVSGLGRFERYRECSIISTLLDPTLKVFDSYRWSMSSEADEMMYDLA